ncbi:hypothetical protein V565_025620 [Rhizoctonia solani 123E]|uniref:Uncharacterized protein n=1 Tax=Rhizoctonia solani 123E TaxID=1423351 RepID=A0A074SAB7_9AGAM|nr:hypothetical protein V565_025620 [Rhizoctonia solani 123E]
MDQDRDLVALVPLLQTVAVVVGGGGDDGNEVDVHHDDPAHDGAPAHDDVPVHDAGVSQSAVDDARPTALDLGRDPVQDHLGDGAGGVGGAYGGDVDVDEGRCDDQLQRECESRRTESTA